MQQLGKYTLVRKIATGGMAEVFLARVDGPRGFQKRLVVKRILSQYVEDESFVQMFLNEATLAARLEHPNLVQIFDFGEADGQYFIAMEYIDGPNLRALSRSGRDLEGGLPLHLIAKIISLAAEGLHFAHELRDDEGKPVGLVHRDISPDNVMVSRTGAVKVVDFGIAKATAQLNHTKSGVIKGKMAYMPPEQLAREELDRRADLFALGIVLFEMISGSMPFDSTSEVSIIQAIMSEGPLLRIRARRGDVPPELDAIIARCLEKKPEDRYPTAKDLQADLERYIQSTGHLVTTGDIAAMVGRLFPTDYDTTRPNKAVPDPFEDADGTAPTQARKSGGAQPQPVALSSGTMAAESRVAGRTRAPLYAGLGAAAVAVGVIVTWAALRQPPAPTAPALQPTLPTIALVDAGVPAAHDALVVVELDAGAPDAAVAVVAEPSPKIGHLEFRIRPFATVYLDGRLLGETPLPPVAVPAGRHRLRMVNTQLQKDVAVEIFVKPGENTPFKHNLKE